MAPNTAYTGHPDTYQYLVEEGYSFSLSTYISRGIDLLKKYPGGFIGYTFVFMLLSALASAIPFVGLGVSYCLMAGYFLVCRKLARGEQPEFRDFFQGFDHFLQLLIGAVLINVFVSVGIVLLIIPGIYLAVAYSMVVPLIVLGKLEFWPAMEVSRKVVSKRWWHFLLFAIVVGLLASLGMIFFIVGMFVTLPLYFTATYAAYEDIFAPASDIDNLHSSIDELGKSGEAPA